MVESAAIEKTSGALSQFFRKPMLPASKERATDILTLTDSIMSCTKCPELVKCRNRPVPGYGDMTPIIVFVGEAPGRFGANITGIPFTRDRSGKLFLKMLGLIGLTRSYPEELQPTFNRAYVTNIVKCNPQNPDGTNRSPSKEELLNCNFYLNEEIRLLAPKIIVPLGINAARLILGEKFSGEDFGRELVLQNTIIFPLWHPAYIIRGGGTARITEKRYRKEFLRLLKLILRVAPEFEPKYPTKLREFQD